MYAVRQNNVQNIIYLYVIVKLEVWSYIFDPWNY